MAINAYESTLLIFCESLQIELLDDKDMLIDQGLDKDKFSMDYIT